MKSFIFFYFYLFCILCYSTLFLQRFEVEIFCNSIPPFYHLGHGYKKNYFVQKINFISNVLYLNIYIIILKIITEQVKVTKNKLNFFLLRHQFNHGSTTDPTSESITFPVQSPIRFLKH